MLVTDVAYPIDSITALYRDRADCKNGFDELKNQWGLSGFTTQDFNRCQITAGPARWSTTGGAGTAARPIRVRGWRPSRAARCCWPPWARPPTTLYLTPLHARCSTVKALIANVHAALQHARSAVKQFGDMDRWGAMLRYISERIAPSLRASPVPVRLPATG